MKLAELTQAIEAVAQGIEDWYDDFKKSGASPEEVAKAYFHFRTEYDRIDTARKRLYAVKDSMDKHLLPTVMDEAGVDMIRIPELGHSFSVQQKTSASFLDKEAGFEWLKSIGQEDMIQRTVNAGTLASFVRSLIIDEGIDPPEDVVKVTNYNTTSVRKYTPKKGA